MDFVTRYTFEKPKGKKFTTRSKVDSVNFRTLEDRIKEFMRTGQAPHSDDIDEEYDLPEEELSSESEARDETAPLDPLNDESLDRFDVIDLYNNHVNIITQTEENAREAVKKIGENNKKSAKTANENKKLAGAIADEIKKANASVSGQSVKADGK